MSKKHSLAIGTTIGPYKIVRLIGVGGMGEVYEAYERRLDRRIALKIISPEQAEAHGQDEMVFRFIQEARTLAKVIHPNVVTIHTVDSADGIQFIAMEYVDGVSLKELLRHFTLNSDEAATMFIHLLEGLRALHENRIVHRDMKPHNLMLRTNGQVKILDFGIAKREDDNSEHTTAGVIVGSVPYMPPEVRSGQAATVRSDLWSVGAILYECLVGRPLIRSMPALGKAAAKEKQSEVAFTQEMAMMIPLEMREIVERLCARKPESRYASATEVIEELRRFQAGRPPLAVDPTSTLAGKVEQILARQPKAEAPTETPRQATVLISRELQNGVHANTDDTRIRAIPRTAERRTNQARPTQVGVAVGLVIAVLVGLWFGLRGETPDMVRKPANSPVRPANNNPPAAQSVARPLPEPLVLSAPRDGQTLWLEINQIATLAWSRLVDTNEFDLQIAGDRDFRNLIISEPVEGKSFRPDRVLPEGSYYWRLHPRKPGGKATETYRFTLSYTIAPEMLKPEGKQIIELPKGQNDLIVPLSWKCKPGSQKYRAQIASDVGFQTGLSERITAACGVQDLRVRAGNYYWRVRVEEPSVSLRVWTEPRSFTVRSMRSKDDDFELFEPRILSQQLNTTLRFKRGTQELLNPPVLEWQSLKGARSYVVQISSASDFSHLLSEERTTTQNVIWKNASPGGIFWRVYGINSLGQKSNFSSKGQLNIQLPPPSLRSEYKAAADARTYQLQWSPVPFAEQYLVQWSASANMSDPSQKLVRSPEFRLDVKNGKQFVRVAVASGSGERASEFSKVARIHMQAATKPAPVRAKAPPVQEEEPVVKPEPPREPTAVAVGVPGQITPPNGAKVDSRNRRLSVVFSWTPVDDAVGYAIEVSSDADFKQVLQRRSTGNPRFVYKNAELKGKVYWRVRAESATGSPGAWSPSSVFEVK